MSLYCREGLCIGALSDAGSEIVYPVNQAVSTKGRGRGGWLLYCMQDHLSVLLSGCVRSTLQGSFSWKGMCYKVDVLADGSMYQVVVAGTGVHVQADVALGALQGTILSAPLLLQSNCVLLPTICRCHSPCGAACG